MEAHEREEWLLYHGLAVFKSSIPEGSQPVEPEIGGGAPCRGRPWMPTPLMVTRIVNISFMLCFVTMAAGLYSAVVFYFNSRAYGIVIRSKTRIMTSR